MADKKDLQEVLDPNKVSKLAVVLAVFGILSLIIAAGGGLAYLMWPSENDPAEAALARTSLQHVIDAAEAYRNENDRVYEGLNAAKLSGSVSETVVNGMPKAGQVGITDYNSKRLVLVYVGASGRDYKVTIKEGKIEWGF